MNKSFLKYCFVALVLFGAVACFPLNAMALQGRAPSGPIGGTDINQALVGPTGLYGGLVYGYMDFTDWVDGDGNKTHVGGGAQISAIAFAYVWDTTLFGGSIVSSFSMGYQDQQDWYVGDPAASDDFSGLIDVYSDIFFWGRLFPSEHFATQPRGSHIPYGLGVGGGLGITFPTGSYDDNATNSVGSNTYTIAPSVALTYTMPSLVGKFLGDATQFSVRIFYNEYTDEKNKNYRNGDIVNIDYAASQIKGDWQYGLAGSYYKQVKDDAFLNGTTGVSNRTMMWSLGPVVNYNFAIKEHLFSAKVKACVMLAEENTTESRIIFFSVGTKF